MVDYLYISVISLHMKPILDIENYIFCKCFIHFIAKPNFCIDFSISATIFTEENISGSKLTGDSMVMIGLAKGTNQSYVR